MSLFSSGVKGLGNALGSGAKKLGNSILGDASQAGVLGTGQYKAKAADINQDAFTNTQATDARRAQFANALKTADGRAAPTMNAATIDQGNSNAWRGQQTSLADQLLAQSKGQGGPSLAEMQMQQGLNQSIANANAQAASARGVNPAMALRMAQNTAANAQQSTAGQTAQLRAQEQQAAQDQYANVVNNARAQDIGLATNQAQLGQQASANNQTAELQNRQTNDAQDRFLREGQMTMDERDRQAAMGLGTLQVNQNQGLSSINSGAYQNAASNRQGMIGGIGQGIAAMMSDENTKKNVTDVSVDGGNKFIDAINAATKPKDKDQATTSNAQSAGKGIGMMLSMAASALSDKNEKSSVEPSPNEAKSFLDALTAYTYDYKDPEKFGKGKHLGVMAQDLEKTPVGKTMVEDTPEGKMVNFGKAGGVMLATASMLNDRLDALESAFKARKERKGA